MKSVGIVTIVSNRNFGNRLQNFALQEALKELGCGDVATIRDDTGKVRGRRRLRAGADRLRDEGIQVVLPYLKGQVGRFDRAAHQSPALRTSFLGYERERAIRTFADTHIPQVSFNLADSDGIRRILGKYDYFAVGSDQVWNPEFGLRRELRFLRFAGPKQRMAYAASVGADVVPTHMLSTYRSGILGLDNVSVREDRAAEMVRELTEREVPVVLDPTMLLEPARWESLAEVPQSLADGAHVAEFFLGSASDEEMFPIQQFAADRGFDRVDLKRDAREDLATMGPLEFIGAIKASKILVTDSFHAAVFATIFRVPYLLKGRGAMNSRFDTLLSKSGLPMPRWGTLKELEASIDIDWDSVHQRIARERADSLDYLRTALSLPTGA